APRSDFTEDAKEHAAVLRDQLEPPPGAMTGEINAAEKQTGSQMADLICDRLRRNRSQRFAGSFGVVGITPRLPDLALDLRNAHLLRRVCHVKGSEVQPVLGAGQAALIQ